MSNRVHLLLRLAWIAGLIVVIVGSLLPEDSLPIRELDALNISDKLEHFAAYAALAFLPALHQRRTSIVFIALAVLALGILLEFLQTPVGRDFEIGDIVADAAGVGVGLALGCVVRARFRI